MCRQSSIWTDTSAQLFFAMDSLQEKAPPVNVSSDTLNAISSGTNPTLYDAVGRGFRVGVRCKL